MHTPEGQKPRKGTLGALGAEEFERRMRRLEVLGGETNSETKRCLQGESDESEIESNGGGNISERVIAREDRAFAHFRKAGETGEDMKDALMEGVEYEHMGLSEKAAIKTMARHGITSYLVHDLRIFDDPEEKK